MLDNSFNSAEAADGAPCCTTVAEATTSVESRFGTAAVFGDARRVATGAAVVAGGFMAALTAAAPTTPTTIRLSVHALNRTIARRRRLELPGG